MDVMGIDPGSQRTGWGVIREISGTLKLVDCGIIRTTSTCRKGDGEPLPFSGRLAYIYRELCGILKKYSPDCAAIEQVFTAHNPQSALKLGQARGVAVAACASFGLEIFDYEPTLVKKAIVGTGHAQKEQVAFMVKRILNVSGSQWSLDTTDALAVAICRHNQSRFIALGKKIAFANNAS